MGKSIPSIIEKDRNFGKDDHLTREPECRGMKYKARKGIIIAQAFMWLNWVNIQRYSGGEK